MAVVFIDPAASRIGVRIPARTEWLDKLKVAATTPIRSTMRLVSGVIIGWFVELGE